MMTLAQIERLQRGITARTGANVRVARKAGNEAHRLVVTLADVDPRVSFTLAIDIGYQRLEVSVEVGPFAGPLLQEMGRATPTEKGAFCSLAKAIVVRRGKIDFGINGTSLSPLDAEHWPMDWTGVRLGVSRAALDVEGAAPEEKAALIEEWASLVLLMFLALATRRVEEEVPEPFLPEPGLPEGARVAVMANRYERSTLNRLRCLAIQGSKCVACDMDFGTVYGEIGLGFIHVHHVTPVSRMGPGYIVDPAKDLVPVCPNCHSIVHRREPPLSIADVRQLLGIRRS